jgi:hypothetical protein
MHKSVFLLVVGAIVGALLAAGGIIFFYESSATRFISSWLSQQERISIEAFINSSAEASASTQQNYLLFVGNAEKQGLISESDYQRGAALANIRLCINYEERGDVEKATKVCKWAADHLSQWKSKWSVEEFKRAHMASREKKKIPKFSLDIITENEN